ncbi:alpha-hydroxy acid oxidase [Quadrisphaera setariae]|uniref:Alpha-hydroxy-acid oxidizing protein n=1 Tax=Quadrisphaera setariae TaxID=2593304 RepID=A0A5C8Z6C2_9ACTN|nr:alpha-hydroxy acid oxidase [Quadrisphaera setariae]TXR52748.1 alpha-hydroxy-acid oxidizing protein [Quadrisphaera setariae]
MTTTTALFDRLEAEARAELPAHVAGYVAATAGAGQCHAEGLRDWAAARLVPRVLQGVSRTDAELAATTVLGTPLRTPVLVAPMAQQVAAHPRGEAETARAVAAAGSLLGVSTNTAVPFDEVAVAGAPWWYQVYVLRDRSLTAALVERAAAAGATALVLTVDTTALTPSAPGGQSIEPTEWPAGPGRERLTALTQADLADREAGAATPALDVGLETIGWLAERTGLPVVVKGVLHPDDARACAQAGAAGVVVSTHGGRRLGESVTSAAALPGVVAAVRSVDAGVEVYADSGVRSGAAVAWALAQGARAVFVGRPVWWGLAARGADGVAAVLEALTADVVTALRQCGDVRA